MLHSMGDPLVVHTEIKASDNRNYHGNKSRGQRLYQRAEEGRQSLAKAENDIPSELRKGLLCAVYLSNIPKERNIAKKEKESVNRIAYSGNEIFPRSLEAIEKLRNFRDQPAQSEGNNKR